MSNSNSFFYGEEDWDCPLCMEEMDLSDKNFRPCPCGYQVCRFCWHKIREDGNQRCPACRKVYNEDEAEFIPVPQEEINRMKQKKRAIKEKREAAAAAELDLSPAGVALTNEIVNSRRHLCEFRVVQRNLVYVIGISAKIAHEHILKEPEFFGQFGKIIKIVVNKKNFLATNSGSNPPSASAYITFVRKDDAAKAIECVDGSVYDDRVIRATYGTTKYCSYFLRGLTCQNPGCMYLHEPGEDVQSFTKEQLAGVNHNLHSFIVDKSESANFRQFGTVMVAPSSSNSKASVTQPLLPTVTSANSSQPVSVPSRSQTESPALIQKSATPAPNAPPGLKGPIPSPESLSTNLSAEPALNSANPNVPLINELSTNSFFDRISQMVTSSELEEFASMAPRGLSFFAPKSPPPPPPAVGSLFNFSPLDPGSFSGMRKHQSRSPVNELVGSTETTSSPNSSCPSRQSFSFANLPIRSPKPVASPASPPPPGNFFPSTAASSANLSPAVPAPVKALPVESLFPSDYRPQVSIETKITSSTAAAPKASIPTTKNTSSSAPFSSTNSSPSSSSSNLKITIAGKPIETLKSSNVSTTTNSSNAPASISSGSISKTSSAEKVNSAAFTNRNIFDLLQQNESEQLVEMPSPSSASKKASEKDTVAGIGPIKVINTSTQPQSHAELERLARENKLDSHLNGMEESMFRTRLEAESLEAKLKMLFEASAQAKHQSRAAVAPSLNATKKI